MESVAPIDPEERFPHQCSARVIAISSGKGGVGKSTLSLNLAVELSLQGHKVCVFDADTNLANINIMTGLTPRYTLHELLTEKKSLQEILLGGPAGIKIIPAASGVLDLVSFDRQQQELMINSIQELEKVFDFILIDTAAGISETVLGFLTAAPEIIITITSEPTSLTDAFSLLKLLTKQGRKPPVQVVVNRAKSYQSAREVLQRFAGALKKYLGLNIKLAGYVLEDSQVERSIIQQTPCTLLSPDSPASCCIKNFTEKLLGKEETTNPRFSDYLLDQKNVIDKERVNKKISSSFPGLDGLLNNMQTAPMDVTEQMVSMVFQAWGRRQVENEIKLNNLNAEGYQAAIRFASRAGD